jgi:hypothetical protein
LCARVEELLFWVPIVCGDVSMPWGVVPTSPFIALKGRAQVATLVRKEKKQKKEASGAVVVL